MKLVGKCYKHLPEQFNSLSRLPQMYIKIVDEQKLCRIDTKVSILVIVPYYLTLIHLGGCPKRPHWYVLLYNFLITHPNFMKFGEFY